MARQITRWSSDTCNCVIDLAWDSDADPIVHTAVACQPCPTHAAHAIGALPLPARYVRDGADLTAVDPKGRALRRVARDAGSGPLHGVVAAEHRWRTEAVVALAASLQIPPDQIEREIAWRFDDRRQLVLSLPRRTVTAEEQVALDAAVSLASPEIDLA